MSFNAQLSENARRHHPHTAQQNSPLNTHGARDLFLKQIRRPDHHCPAKNQMLPFYPASPNALHTRGLQNTNHLQQK